MKELENLLTSLVQKGWKPFWKERCFRVDRVDKNTYEVNCGNIGYRCSLRDLVSLESGLWQFCMENGLLNSPDQYPHKDYRAKNPRPYWEISLRRDCYYKTEVYQYRLIESALIPEEELGQFLIDNIVIEWNSK